MINEVKAGFNRSTLRRYTYGPLPSSIASPGFTTLNQSNLLVETGTSYSIIDNLVINRGAHTIKIGGEIRRAHVNVADPAFDHVSVTYANRTLSRQPGGQSSPSRAALRCSAHASGTTSHTCRMTGRCGRI